MERTEDVKRCIRCLQTLSVSSFYWHKADRKQKGRLHSPCKRCCAERAKTYHETNRERMILKMRSYRQRNLEKLRLQSREYYRWARPKRKAEVLAAYGNKCACCGESAPVFLTIDHINNEGAAERKATRTTGSTFYAWLQRRGYPPGYQVLCWNCNWAKSHGGCPHKEIPSLLRRAA